MTILYVILTCQKYLPTRCEWQKRSWLKNVDNYVFISSTPDPDNRVVGWNTPDDYAGCAQKYVAFFKNTPPTTDWTVCVDDDTFVFPKRLELLLTLADPSHPVCIGKVSTENKMYPPYTSGGGGFAISRVLHERIHSYLNANSFVPMSIFGDVTMGEFVKLIGGSFFHDDRFNIRPHTKTGSIRSAVTFHFVTETLFAYYSTLLDQDDRWSPTETLEPKPLARLTYIRRKFLR